MDSEDAHQRLSSLLKTRRRQLQWLIVLVSIRLQETVNEWGGYVGGALHGHAAFK